MNSRTSAPSYLIVCFRFIGDVLVTTPLALSIKTANPDAVVDYLVFKGTEKALSKNPYIRNTITIPRDTTGLRTLLSLFKKYDVAIAANPSDRAVLSAAIAGKQAVGFTNGLKKEWWKSALLDRHNIIYDHIHVVSNMFVLLRMLGIEPVPRVVMGYDDSDMAFALGKMPFQRYIILHPYSMKAYKYWPAEKWARLASLIQEQTDCVPVFTRTPEPEGDEYLEQIRKCAPQGIEVFDSACSLNQLAAIIKGSAAFVGIDTAITHIAAAVEIPTVAIFGPTLTRYWAPWPNGCNNKSVFAAGKGVQRHNYVTVVQKNWECVPCNLESCAISTRGATECLVQLGEHEVLGALMGVLDQGKGVQEGSTRMNILLYHFGYRGDILVVGQNFTRELQVRYPEAAIDMMVRPGMAEARNFMGPLGLYRSILLGDKKDFHDVKRDYDLAFIIDEHIYPEGHLRSVFTHAGFDFRQHRLTLKTLEDDEQLARKIAAHYKRPLIATQDDMARKWPMEKVEKLWKRLSGVGSLIYIGPNQIFPGVDRHLSFMESAALLRQADIFVGIDSGLGHAAALVGTQTVLLLMAHPESWIAPTEYANPFIEDENAKHISIRPPQSEFCGHYLCLQPTSTGGIKRPSGNPLLVKCAWKKRFGIFKGTSCYNKISVDTFSEAVIGAMRKRKLL